MKAPDLAGTNEQSDPLVGTIVDGQLEIRRLLGQGGMGSVYEAYHQGLHQVVAIKVLHRKLLTSPDAVRRLQSEAQIAGNLNHPNLVATQKFGFVQKDLPFIQMEFLNGISLSDYLASQGPLEKPEFINIFTQCAEGLLHAHERGVVHRDIKPSNIILLKQPEGDDFLVKIADFGIAKALTAGTGMGQRLTQTGDVIGTPMYMSPEQCQSKQVDHRSDIYSLGCVMYEALCGHGPFEADNAFEVMMKHTNEEASSPVQYKPELSDEQPLVDVVTKMLAKNPEDRYATVSAVAHELRACEHRQAKAHISWRRAAGLPKVSKGVAMLAVAFAVVSGGLYGITLVKERTPLAEETRDLSNTPADELFASGERLVKAHQYELAKRQLSAFLDRIYEKESGSNFWRLRPEFATWNQFEKAVEAQSSIDQTEKGWPDHHGWFRIVNSLDQIFEMAPASDMTNTARHLLFDKAQTVETRAQNAKSKDETVADNLGIAARIRTSFAYHQHGRFLEGSPDLREKSGKEAVKNYEYAIDDLMAQNKIMHDEASGLSTIRAQFGRLLKEQGQYTAAEKQIELAWALDRLSGSSSDTPKACWTNSQVGSVRSTVENLQVTSLVTLGECYLLQGNWGEAQRAYQKAVAVCVQQQKDFAGDPNQLREANERLAYCQRDLAYLCLFTENFRASKNHALSGLAATIDEPPKHMKKMQSELNALRAYSLAQMGDSERAANCVSHVMPWIDGHEGAGEQKEHRYLTWSFVGLTNAMLAERSKDQAKAIKEASSAYEDLKQIRENSDGLTNDLAFAYLATEVTRLYQKLLRDSGDTTGANAVAQQYQTWCHDKPKLFRALAGLRAHTRVSAASI